MSTYIHMICDGQCGNETSIEVKRTFNSFNGRGYGFGTYHEPSISETANPTGWVWSDIINCTYCPECWAEIMKEAGEGSIYERDACNAVPDNPEEAKKAAANG